MAYLLPQTYRDVSNYSTRRNSNSLSEKGSKPHPSCKRRTNIVILSVFAFMLFTFFICRSSVSIEARNRLRIGNRVLSIEGPQLKSTEITDGLEYFLGPVFEMDEGFTVVTPTYRRNELLPPFLSLYGSGKIPSLRKIILIWMDQENEPPQWLLDSLPSYQVPVVIRRPTRNAMNERFRPDPTITTACVFSLDDDVRLDPVDVEQGYEAWKSFGLGRLRMVGYTPREVSSDLKYVTKHVSTYSMVLAKNAFFHVDWYKGFWSDEMSALRTYIDEGHYCEDVLMSFLVASKTRIPPIYFNAPFGDEGLKNGISTKSGHYGTRTTCVRHFLEELGSDTMISTSLQIQRRE